MKIYVACLASYNNGVLHGRWIDASPDVDEMRDEVNAILRESPFPNVMVTCPDCDGDAAVEPELYCGTCKCTGEVPSAEEFAIHDFEGLPSSLGEYCGLDTIADVVEFIEETASNNGIEEAGAIALLDDCCGDLDEARERAQEFCGEYPSFREYAEEYADECILEAQGVPEMVSRYFDYDAFARDLKMDMHVIDVPTGVLVFHA